MTEISRNALFGKLNSLAYQAIESATTFCKLRGNSYVELVHWLHQILQMQDSDLSRIIRHFELNPAALARDMTDALDRLPRGASSLQDLSSHVDEAVERGWVYSTLMFGDARVRTGHLLVGILKTAGLRRALEGISKEFAKINLDTLTARFQDIVSGSPEDRLAATDGSQLDAAAAPSVGGPMAPAALGKQEALQQFSTDLTEKARKNEIDPIVARDEEIRQIIDILMRRRQNNPILTGEAGVGKTAVVEGFALRIAAGDVPPPLQNVTLRALDVGLLQAGASYKGEFEKRLRQVIDEVQASQAPIILFIDEAHTLIGAGGTAGTGDAANLLKPALARGTLRTVAATTWTEYKKYIEKDPALTRRFQVVQINEPGEKKAVLMMRSMASVMETHHRVQVLDEALEASVSLSHRYIPARQLPDKSVSLLDTACARVAISQHAIPPEIDDCRKRIGFLETELAIIDRESRVGIDTKDRHAAASQKLDAEQERLQTLEARWEEEKDLVDQILAIRQNLRETTGQVDSTVDDEQTIPEPETADTPAVDHEALRESLLALQADLQTLQGESPLILPTVDAQSVASVVADWTGIPVGRMVKNEIDTVLNLADILNRRILGQRHALEMIASRIQTSRANLDNPGKPIGVFLLAGPSGVGKTETALALAEALYGGEQNVVTINMSEFQEAHTVSTLKGAPPGYVGYGEGGILTEAVRRKPYSVILLDEVEKAHSDVHEIFFQVFDKGWMEDGEGRFIDFKNTLILLTTNVGTDLIMNMCKDPDLYPEPEGLAKALRKPLLDAFPAALLGRLVSIAFYPLSNAVLGDIVRLQLGRIQQRIQDNHKIPFTFDDEVIAHIVSRCTELESGGRMIDAILTNTVLPRVSREILTALMEGRSIARTHLCMDEEKAGFAYAFD
ncbi:ClpV: type VI secretion system ATPase [Desulfosarcina variabilis str. Montpellier]|uniref:type VI secretion system ATPase TssH n=1 Tax=Desulfosarcina variabilis TaxID=2300 RepID=UPI003AFA0633